MPAAVIADGVRGCKWLADTYQPSTA